ncbi:UNC-like C-terminal-domain-containing protein [Russula compacta]|nr:UNC-like C-terminal-domain-containing protein [Russula compacta]
MFIRWPQTWLLLLFASAVLSGHPQSTTPHDPFHAIAALAPKPSEEPICCLKPLTPLEPVDDDIFLSFEDWKAKRFSESSNNQRNNAPPPPNTNGSPPPPRVPAAEESPAEAAAAHTSAAVVDATAARAPETAADAVLPQTVQGVGTTPPPIVPPSPGSVSPHFRVPLTDRFNYASVDCSARVHTAHPAAKSASNILSSKRDRYMLWPCNAATTTTSTTTAGRRPPLFVVVELCDDIRIDTVQMANFEFFSGVFREFTVSVAKTYIAADAEGWTVVGTYVGKNVRGVQSFHPPTSIRDFYRYIRVDFHSHYSNEYYCPISLLRVYGLTHLEQWKWDTWEEESRARQDLNAHTTIAHADILPESEQPADTPLLAQKHTTSQESPSPSSPPSDSTMNVQDQRMESSSQLLESTEGHFRHTTEIVRSEPSTSPPISSVSPDDSSTNATPSSACPSPPDFLQANDNNSTQRSHMFIDNDPAIGTTTASTSVFISSRSASVSGTTESTSRSSSQLIATTTASPSVIHSSPSPPHVVNHPLSPSPMNVHSGESIYRTIMNRLSALEANTTLYARYVEEQTNAMREMFRRLSEDVGRLEGIGRAQAQMYARSVNDFEKHRREMAIEQRTLISQVNYLAEEIVLEKRLGIAQLCLLLAVLVFLSVTRGSPGEFHMPRVNVNSISRGADSSMRSWGRRSLRLSGDWVPSGLRNASSGPPSASQGPPTPTPLMPIPRARVPVSAPATAPAASTTLLSLSTTTTRALVTTTPTFRQKRVPLYQLTPIQHQHHPHYRVPRSRSAHARTRSGGGATPTPPIPPPVIVPVQRSSSHGVPVIGPVPRSARRWARSAHLHEVRRAWQQQHHHHSVSSDAGGAGEDEEDVFAAAAVPPPPPPRSHSLGWRKSKSRSSREDVVDTTWVDTDTDADADDDSGVGVGDDGLLWQVEGHI